MTKAPSAKAPAKPEAGKLRLFPKIHETEEGGLNVVLEAEGQIEATLGMQTKAAAEGVLLTALDALGGNAKDKANMVAAMFAEIEPQDAVEAMLVAQMTATHVAMTTLSRRMLSQQSYLARESCERSVTRLSRSYLAQMEALRKYRAKGQQVVRVERVTVESGGQAIVGNVQHGGGGKDE
ncbi:MAG: hypothetical protein ACRBBV_18100 [Paracoccaceae bacterium]